MTKQTLKYWLLGIAQGALGICVLALAVYNLVWLVGDTYNAVALGYTSEPIVTIGLRFLIVLVGGLVGTRNCTLSERKIEKAVYLHDVTYDTHSGYKIGGRR
jgi:hypothetical protein